MAVLWSCQNEADNMDTSLQDLNSRAMKAGSIDTWEDVFNPTNVISMYLRMTSADWETIRKDVTNDIEVPVWFRADGEEEIVVSVRRKSCRPLPSDSDPIKISMKVDINEYAKDQLWHDLKKLSLESGSDVGPVAEGVAWNLHELASTDEFYGADEHPGLAAWVKVFVKTEDGEELEKDENPVVESEYQYLGVYINVEQRDEQFMVNRGVYVDGLTFLYEVDDIDGTELDVGDFDSDTHGLLDFSPFRKPVKVRGKIIGDAPEDEVLKGILDEYIDMQAMLTQGAIDAFSTNPDALFSHGKNFKFIDFNPGAPGFSGDLKRQYFPWDLDAVFGRIDYPIYAVPGGKKKVAQSEYQKVIINHPEYRVQYNEIMTALILGGPLDPGYLGGKFDEWKAAVDEALMSDPYEHYGEHMNFDDMKQWVQERANRVLELVDANDAPRPRN